MRSWYGSFPQTIVLTSKQTCYSNSPISYPSYPLKTQCHCEHSFYYPCLPYSLRQIRAMGGPNPTPVEAKNRLRLLLMGAAPSVAAATHDKPRASGASVLLEEAEPAYLSAAALDLGREPPAEQEVPDSHLTIVEDLVVSAAQPDPTPPVSTQPAAAAVQDSAAAAAVPQETGDPAAPPTEPNIARQALAYVAGYVVAKCPAADKTMGQSTSEAGTESRDERLAWIDAISQGGLTAPGTLWLSQVEELEVLFVAMHGKTGIDRGLGVVRRLAEAAALKFPNVHPRVLRKYAMTRTQLRVRELQRRRPTSSSTKRPPQEPEKSYRAAKRARYHVYPL